MITANYKQKENKQKEVSLLKHEMVRWHTIYWERAKIKRQHTVVYKQIQALQVAEPCACVCTAGHICHQN